VPLVWVKQGDDLGEKRQWFQWNIGAKRVKLRRDVADLTYQRVRFG